MRSQCHPSWGYAAEGLSVCIELFRPSGVPLGYGARLSAAVEAGEWGCAGSGGLARDVLPGRGADAAEDVLSGWPSCRGSFGRSGAVPLSPALNPASE